MQDVSPSSADAGGSVLRAKLIANPQAGHNAAVHDQLGALLAGCGIHADVTFTTPEDEGTGFARAAVAAGYTLIIAAGGDGTIEAVAKGLIGTDVALGILPLGTQNNLARSLHIPVKVEDACTVLANGKRQHIDVGLANGAPFFEMVSIGIEVPLLSLGESARHHGLGSAIGAMVQGLGIFRDSRIHRVKLDLDGKHRKARTRQISVCNTPRYGPGLVIAPAAQLDDGLLDVVITHQYRRRDLLRHYWQILRGNADLTDQDEFHRARQIRITGRHPLPVSIDGTAAGTTPVSITLAPQQLTVMVPREPNISQPLPAIQRIWNAIASS